MAFVNNTKQKELFMVADTAGVKNAAKYAISLLYLKESGVLVAVTNFDLNHAGKNTRNNSEQPKVRINEDRKRVCNRSKNYFQN